MRDMEARSATACVVGCGPAGAMLGLLLARAGIETLVLEKHADFLRDFRGDTVHPSTIEVLGEIGLAERFLELPHRKVPTIGFVQAEGGKTSPTSARSVAYPYIAFVPQRDFLNLITAEARQYPNFRLLMRAEAYDIVREEGRVVGVRYRDTDGEHEARADLTVATDGRHSAIRGAAGLRPREFGAPMDVVMVPISRRDTDPDEGYHIRMASGRSLVVINRDSYWNLAYMIRKDGHAELRARGVQALRDDLASLVSFLADRVGEITSFADTGYLEVRVNRLRRWHAPGLLLIGDAAHAMSPIGGVGINLAVQDAVAAANLLTGDLRRAQRLGVPVPVSAVAAVQRRRWWPTVATQAFQRLVQRFGIDRALRGGTPNYRAIGKNPLVRRTMGRLIGVGIRPEHVRELAFAPPRTDPGSEGGGR